MSKSRKAKFSWAISTLAGSSFPNLIKVRKGNAIHKPYRRRWRLSSMVSLICEPFRLYEDLVWKKRVKGMRLSEDPVFILGHWRSGTTLLHNLLSQDRQFGYCTTYHTIFPHILLSNQWWLSAIVGIFMPDRRPSDNLPLGLRLPQEEGMAMCNIHPYNLYLAWYFPADFEKYYRLHVERKGVTTEMLESWKVEYLKFVKRAMLNTGGRRFLSKNLPFTFKIDLLLEMFPNAKFIYLYRNPYEVHESTRKFVRGVLPATRHQDFPDEKLDPTLLRLQRSLIDRYEQDRVLIPEENLIELSYEDFLEDKMGTIQRIYAALDLGGYAEAVPGMEAYLHGQNSYRSVEHDFRPETIRSVNDALDGRIEALGYEKLEG